MALDIVDIATIGKRKIWVKISSISKKGIKLVSVLWKRLVPIFLVVFPDETTDVEESGTTFVPVFTLGPLPQESEG